MGIGFELEGLSKSFGRSTALEGVTCGFRPGEISAVIGPNGSGKTTLLRIMARLEDPGSGTVRYIKDGRELTPDRSLMLGMTLVGQRPTLFNMSLYGNVSYGLRLRGLEGDALRRRVREALEAGELSGLARRRARTLSGGEAQRAAIVRAYALRPEAVLMDEPTAGLDPDNTALAEGLIRRMNDESGATVVLVTHNLFQARRLAQRVFFLMGGRLVEHGEAPGFFSRPADPLTARYISGELVC